MSKIWLLYCIVFANGLRCIFPRRKSDNFPGFTSTPIAHRSTENFMMIWMWIKRRVCVLGAARLGSSVNVTRRKKLSRSIHPAEEQVSEHRRRSRASGDALFAPVFADFNWKFWAMKYYKRRLFENYMANSFPSFPTHSLPAHKRRFDFPNGDQHISEASLLFHYSD